MEKKMTKSRIQEGGMMTYSIQRGGKIYRSRGDDAYDAISRLANRILPNGNTWWYSVKLKMIDADTYGKKWATAIVDGVYTQAEKV